MRRCTLAQGRGRAALPFCSVAVAIQSHPTGGLLPIAPFCPKIVFLACHHHLEILASRGVIHPTISLRPFLTLEAGKGSHDGGGGLTSRSLPV